MDPQSCPRCHPPIPQYRCDYPGCGYLYADELHRIAHEAVYDEAAHVRRVQAFGYRR